MYSRRFTIKHSFSFSIEKTDKTTPDDLALFNINIIKINQYVAVMIKKIESLDS